jgi:DNA-binding Lrp family transcriptional regulator
MLDAVDFLLVNPWQRGFPLEPRPFAPVARKAGIGEEEALARLGRLQQQGVIDRIGPVFRPNTVGASSLAAIAVPPERLAEVAAFVSDQPGVNHNYEREHRYSLWFVATGRDAKTVEKTIRTLEEAVGLRVLRLPLLEEFHIDLGFDLESRDAPREAAPQSFPPLSPDERRLVAATAAGLPLVLEPYREVSSRIGMPEREVLSRLSTMLADGRIRRIGAVVRHRRLGYEANAMAVWDVPDGRVSALARRLARDPAVTLCYRRARALPDWPYNLYCMVHGRLRALASNEIARLAAAHGLDAFPHAVLFSNRCFSQRPARYG